MPRSFIEAIRTYIKSSPVAEEGTSRTTSTPHEAVAVSKAANLSRATRVTLASRSAAGVDADSSCWTAEPQHKKHIASTKTTVAVVAFGANPPERDRILK
jgi:hypothetical protein